MNYVTEIVVLLVETLGISLIISYFASVTATVILRNMRKERRKYENDRTRDIVNILNETLPEIEKSIEKWVKTVEEAERDEKHIKPIDIKPDKKDEDIWG